jgi:hypothetical protein
MRFSFVLQHRMAFSSDSVMRFSTDICYMWCFLFRRHAYIFLYVASIPVSIHNVYENYILKLVFVQCKWMYRVIQKDGLSFVRIYFLMWIICKTFEIGGRKVWTTTCLAHRLAAASEVSKIVTMQHKNFAFVCSLKPSRRLRCSVEFAKEAVHVPPLPTTLVDLKKPIS